MSQMELFVMGLQFLLILFIGYDAGQRRWMSRKQSLLLLVLVVFLPMLGAVIYLLVVVFTEARLPSCPECGSIMQRGEDRCLECGHVPDRENQQPGDSSEKQSFECERCDMVFETFRGLMRHRTRHVSEASDGGDKASYSEDKVFECGECGSEFDTERGRSIHVSKKH
ncbi:MAG: hypothetical protein SVV03_02945 [Candidatus Nanohaloarchaea archaeon]|nr:hypothetical protein [Candidatus Nanohaloarchaea archaeon]